MKLYCVKLQRDDEILDVNHMVASSNKEVHDRLDKTIEQCVKFGLEYNAYSFFEVNMVDNVNLSEIMNKIEI